MKRHGWTRHLLALLILSTFALGFGATAIVRSTGVAQADVCVNVGRRVSVIGCANVADAISRYAPPPGYYAPLPEDYPPPPPP
ncbi:hypothetical protein [Mycobacterium sp.]|uniref:hypothetical protein n=1 Tax=Mycobacterium sp. TaxID=1785 RepID=UPI003BA8669C